MILLSTETSFNPADCQKIFVDRAVPRQVFNVNIGKISPGDDRLIYYTGVGGVGKTALIRKLENSLQDASRIIMFKYVSYDFTYGAGMLPVLNALKKLLADKYEVEFALFEKGCLSYYQKRGDEAGAMAAAKILKGSKTLKRTRQH